MNPAALLSRLWLGLFLAQFAWVWIGLWLPRAPWGRAGWPEALLLLLALGGMLAAQARQVPRQNVAMASFIITSLAALCVGLGRHMGITLGPVAPGETGDRLDAWLAWSAAVWLLVLLVSREVARQILRPRRAFPNYGFQVIGLAVLLVAFFLVACQPLAARAGPSRALAGAPGIALPAQAATALLALIAATPWLIDKRGVEVRPSRRPVLLWALAHLMFLTAAVGQHRWALAALASAGASLVPALALRGAAAPAPARR